LRRAPNCATGPRFDLPDGAEGTRTPDLYSAIVALSHLSYSPSLATILPENGEMSSIDSHPSRVILPRFGDQFLLMLEGDCKIPI
jgi:hypothetical protein